MTTADGQKKIVILGGGFAGFYTARHLERLSRHLPNVQVTLVSRQNYFLMTPLLFEAGSGVLEPRHAVSPLRPLLDRTRFFEAEVESIDLDRKVIQSKLVHVQPLEIPYDHLVLAMGGVTNTAIIPGAQDFAMTFKTLADAIILRNHAIQRFEQADVETDPERKKALLTFVIVGAGFVGLELQGELTEFLRNLDKAYRNITYTDLRFELVEHGPRIAPEFDQELTDYAANLLRSRGVSIRVNTAVQNIEPGIVYLSDGTTISAETIIVATGVVANPLIAMLPLEKGRSKRIKVDPTMQVTGKSDLWAIGDCASIPDPQGNPYPPLAQHALREAKVLACNIVAALENKPLKPFIYKTKGSLAALGHYKGVGKLGNIRIKGFLAWWVWRSYYVMQMPQWSRRIRIIIDWTIALFFKNDVVQIDLTRGESQFTRDRQHAQNAATK